MTIRTASEVPARGSLPGSSVGASVTLRRRRGLPLAAVLLLLPLLAAMPRPAAAQGVLLELRPRAHDTLRLRLDQELEVVATMKVGGIDSLVTMQQRLTAHSRSIVQRADGRGATITAITDSAMVRSAPGAPARRTMSGARVSLHIAPDGRTRVLDAGGNLTPEASALVAGMPATLPRHAIEVGDSWSHVSTVPIPGQPEGAGGGTLTATFRLDSLSRYGDVAYVSIRGTLSRPPGGVKLQQGLTFESAGTVLGSMQVDRRRGWLTSMRAVIDVKSVLSPPAATGAAMHVRTRVTQWLRAVDKP